MSALEAKEERNCFLVPLAGNMGITVSSRVVILFARDFEYGARDGKGLGHGGVLLGLMAVASAFQGWSWRW